MGTFDKALEEKQVLDLLDADNRLKLGERNQRNVSRIIDAVRKAEATYNDELHQLNTKNLALVAELQRLKGELLKYQMSSKLDTFKQLSIADKQDIMDVPVKLLAS